MMHDIKIIVLFVILISIVTIAIYNINIYVKQQNINSEVDELVDYFENILLLNVPTENTRGTPMEMYNKAGMYSSKYNVTEKVRYDTYIDGSRGEIRLKYTQKIYDGKGIFKQNVYRSEECPAIWTIEKRDNEWHVVKIAELDYQYGLSESEYIKALERLHDME